MPDSRSGEASSGSSPKSADTGPGGQRGGVLGGLGPGGGRGGVGDQALDVLGAGRPGG